MYACTVPAARMNDELRRIMFAILLAVIAITLIAIIVD